MSTISVSEGIMQVYPQGRLDAFGSKELQAEIDAAWTDSVLCVVVDMAFVEYLSSAGVRVLVALAKKTATLGGAFALSNVPGYSRQVLKIAGVGDLFPEFPGVNDALHFCGQAVREAAVLKAWDRLETLDLPIGSMRFIPGVEEAGAIEVLGSIQDVLHSRVTVGHLCSKKFSDTEYSLGLGGLGDRVEDYFFIMGEMITVGGTMVWLPTDGHDTADFLIPQNDAGEVTLRTGFNASITGGFNELVWFRSSEAGGTSITNLYRALFDQAAERRSDYRGALGVAMRAEMGEVYGCGVRKSPVQPNMPANGEMVTHPSNFAEWFEIDTVPRHKNVTALLCGAGVDLNADLSAFDHSKLALAFYVNPANPGSLTQQLHNHAVFFSPLPMPERSVNLDKEIAKVVAGGDFMDMRHLLDASTVKEALIGLSYTQEFRRDPHGRQGV